jgi:hypothetical protein
MRGLALALEPACADHALVVRSPQMAPAICGVNRTTSKVSGGLIHAAAGNRQQRSDH